VSSLCEAEEVGTVAPEPEKNLIMKGQFQGSNNREGFDSRDRNILVLFLVRYIYRGKHQIPHQEQKDQPFT
jgi:hypothetical protein